MISSLILQSDEDLSNLDDNVKLKAQLHLDSKDFLDVVMELKKRYKIEVPTEDYRKLATMKTCIEYLGSSNSHLVHNDQL